MIIFRTDTTGVWFKGTDPIFDDTEIGDYDRKDRETLSVLINPMTPELTRKLREQNMTVEVQIPDALIDKFANAVITGGNASRKQKNVIGLFLKSLANKREVNEAEYNKDLMVAVIGDWKGVNTLDKDGKPVELERSRENVLLLFETGRPRMGSAIIRAAAALNNSKVEVAQQEQKGTEKNSQSTGDGSEPETD